MLSRRRFLQCISAAAVTPSVLQACAGRGPAHPSLVPDRRRLLDLPEGFHYRVVSKWGAKLPYGWVVPGAHDGMAAFPGEDGRIVLVCNHELKQSRRAYSALGDTFPRVPIALRKRYYDLGSGVTPAIGGTTTTIYNPLSGRTEHQFMSLMGTELNCAGGATPWGSWLSCEECFESPGRERLPPPTTTRDKRHGYVFEVPADATRPVEPQPIRAMGRFEHEACAVHEPTGIVYMTEDRHYGLFYRYVPEVPGELIRGGRLQALAIDRHPSRPTHNWSDDPDIRLNHPVRTRWIDLDNVDPDDNDLRLRGAAAGAATFARGEGLCNAGDRLAFSCTIGGPARLGQVFTYEPSPYEGTAEEKSAPGTLELIAESSAASLLCNADNLTTAPWGDLIVCEDTASHSGLVGIRPDGSQYLVADNAYTQSELAGACFSPDGSILFVNIQYPGMTLAITGPWETLERTRGARGGARGQ